jgi:hypothetical protein
MFRLACVLSLLWLAVAGASARHVHHPAPEDVTLKVGGLQFTLPATWTSQPPETSARAGQWTVPPPAATPGAEPVEVVVFFFGPGVGGTAKQNIAGWAAAMTAPTPAASPTPQKRLAGGHAVTEVLFSGTYAQPSPEPGLPPVARPGSALWGAVMESGGGTLYWRATGPAAEVTALAPVLDKVLDSVTAVVAVPAPSP